MDAGPRSDEENCPLNNQARERGLDACGDKNNPFLKKVHCSPRMRGDKMGMQLSTRCRNLIQKSGNKNQPEMSDIHQATTQYSLTNCVTPASEATATSCNEVNSMPSLRDPTEYPVPWDARCLKSMSRDRSQRKVKTDTDNLCFYESCLRQEEERWRGEVGRVRESEREMQRLRAEIARLKAPERARGEGRAAADVGRLMAESREREARRMQRVQRAWAQREEEERQEKLRAEEERLRAIAERRQSIIKRMRSLPNIQPLESLPSI